MGTFESAAVVALGILPGGLYVWAFEREAGRWGIALPDRFLRLVGISAFAHVVAAPFTYWLWTTRVREVAAGAPPPWWLWLVLIGYVVVPFASGSFVGRATRAGQSWTAVVTGPDPAPRAWDHFFAARPDGWARLRLKSGRWVAGLYGPSHTGLSSYAAAYPESQDLLLAETVAVDVSTGEFITEDGVPVLRGMSLLVRWDEVEFLEFANAGRGLGDAEAPTH